MEICFEEGGAAAAVPGRGGGAPVRSVRPDTAGPGPYPSGLTKKRGELRWQ